MKKQLGWKKKIDPFFNDLIKIYRDILEQAHLPSNSGYLISQEKYIFMEERGFPSFSEMYEGIKLDKSLFADIKIGLRKHISASPEDLNAQILKQIKTLPAKSKTYYLKKLEPCLSKEEAETRLAGKFKEEIERMRDDLNMDVRALAFHAGSIGYWGLKKSKGLKVSTKKELSGFLLSSLFQAYDFISQLTHNEPIKSIIERARTGDDESFFKAIQVDKTLFDFEWVRVRLRKAMLSGDYDFFDKLGDAIRKTPLENDIEYGELRLVLNFFWDMGLRRLNNDELMELFKASGLWIPANKETFKKLKRRTLNPQNKPGHKK